MLESSRSDRLVLPDNMLSDFSTSPCSHERLNSLQKAWERVKDLKPTSSAVRANRNWIAGEPCRAVSGTSYLKTSLARLFFYFMNTRLFNNHGTEFARMERLYPGRTTRLEEENTHCMIDMFCWVFMFNEPNEIFQVIKQVWMWGFCRCRGILAENSAILGTGSSLTNLGRQ